VTTKNFVVKNGLTTGSITLDATSGNISGTNLSVTGVSNLGAVGNVRITGGSANYVVTTDGAGNLSFTDPVATQSPAPMPTYIATGNTITISSNYQGIFGYPITVDGTIVVDGILVDVNDATIPAGNINFVQYNAGNVMGGDANFYYTAVNGTMTVQNETITGNSTIGNLVVSTTANLGSSSNVKITGGSSGQVLSTDGTGVLSWVSAPAASTATTVTANSQPNITSVGTLTSVSVSGNANIGNIGTAGLITATGNITGGNIIGTLLTGTLSTAAQPNITSLGTLTSVSVSGNANIGNIGTAGLITATGNINAGNLITGGIVSATGNITGAYILGNGSQLTGITATTATTAGTVTTAAQPNITSTGTLASLSVSGNANIGNIGTAGLITATGNIKGANLVTDGNVYANSGNIIAGGVVQGSTLNGIIGGGIYSSQPNISSIGTLSTLSVSANANIGNIGTGGLITATGNISSGFNISAGGTVSAGGSITGANLFTAGQLSAGGVANVGSLTTNSTISAAGNLTVGNISTGGLITATGNLTASNIITGGAVSATGNVNALRLFVSFADSTGVITAPQFTSNIVTGTAPFVVTSTTRVNNLNVATAGTADIAGSVTTNAQPNITSTGTLASLSVTGNVISGNVYANSGTIGASSGSFTTVAGSLTTAAQPNITSTGTLTSVSVSGNAAAGNVTVTGYHFRSVATGISAAGSTQGTATAISKEINIVSTVASGAGVVLPTAVAGMAITITNTSANSLLVYPATGAQINSLGTNIGFTQVSGATLQFVAPTSTQWYTIGATYV